MPRAHIHPELELNLVLSGTVTYATVTGHVDLPPGRLAVFWGGYPHRLVTEHDVDFLWATVPLAAVAGHPVLERALSGTFLYGEADEGPHDRFLMGRWAAEEPSEIALMEIHARLARLAAALPPPAAKGAAEARAAERMLAVVASHYTEDLSVESIAAGAGVHPVYGAQAFKQALGMPVWQYVTQLRLAHARRLLTGTGWGVDRVAHESGFQTRSSFYRAFREGVGGTPSEYRRRSLSR